MSEFGHLAFDDHHVVISLSGVIDLESSAAFDALVDQALEASPNVVFDMSDVTFLDSTGLRVIADALIRTRDNGSIVVRNASDTVLRVLNVSGMDRVVPLELLPTPGR